MEAAISEADPRTTGGPGTLEIVELEGDSAGWDAFVRESRGSSFCHLSGWREVIGGVLGHDCIQLVAREPDGRWAGVLPLVRVKSPLFGHYLLSMPFLNYGGALGTDDAREALSREAVRIGDESGVGLVELRCRGIDPKPPLERVDRKVTVVLELPSDPEVLWKDVLKSKVRSQVRRPQKEGMTARFGVGEIEPFYEVFTRNMRDLGTPVLPAGFFRRIGGVFGDEVEFACIYHAGRPVAAGCGFVWGSEFEITWASSLREYSRMAPNMLLYWSLMERMIERGLGAFNFGRCTPGSGTHRFKGQWGGEDEPLPWGQWSPGGVSETPNPDRPLFRAATRVWSRLPLSVTNRLGPFVSRWLP